MDDRLLATIQNVFQRIDIAPLVEVITNAQRLQVTVAVKLLVIGVRHPVEQSLIFRQ
ncbi:hypothetical protein D3C80_1834730 [compost metagenome]